ncbi:hypothetical protein A2765_00800 [Candidatus Kaiserbacteria bacterium RIFCSPHIGHO2_01_FULL_56_24]|uniref:Uncharacterized protein n=1 Tax=Candidatus Kaiserbacteria bacterium RIFCSPHIGHO2_01_FULL_56_24 TaxID=1798487 RepID=A0A1F6DEY3_9BACT|nr:MAG: hypothetical protein A2765_00800 [Candidatus Kaiserbacteria bacterium RIFCSPHIGHO2_01_FULL_56_24]
MAEEEHAPSIIDSAFEKAAHGIQHLLDGAAHGGGGHGHGKKTFLQKWFSISSWVEEVGGRGISRGTFLVGLYVPLLVAASVLIPAFPDLVLSWLLLGLPIIGPVGLLIGFWGAWVWYVRSNFIFTRTKPILLEVKMPAEITKSPRAMELVLTSLWFRASMTTFIDKYWHGGVYAYYSLEMASIGGEVHFYIWSSRDYYRNIIEANMYAQYPEVEIVEVSDYATDFHYDHHKHMAFVGDYMLESHNISRHDPRANAYPLKTYVDYELDKDPKEELKVEPFAQAMEVLSALNKDEQAWVQIVVRGHFGKEWKTLVEEEVKLLRRQASIQPGKESADESDEKKYGFPRPTWREQELMKSMERNLGKIPYDFGARMVFIGPRNNFRGNEATAIRWIFRPLANPNYGIMLRPRNAHNDFDYPWQDIGNRRYEHETHRYIDAYRRRQMFYPPWQDQRNITSVEVLATLWHPPSSTVRAPGLQRIPSTKTEPPPNLPM